MIDVVEYDPTWPERFGRLRDLCARVMAEAGGPVVSIEHVGSTAVPGLAAKPILDGDVVVEAEQVMRASEALEHLGFIARGELGIPQRWAFYEPERLSGTNTYVVVAGSLALKNHRAVREILRENDALRAEYGAVKLSIGLTAADIYEYGAGKNSTVQRILEEADLSASERASIDSNQVPVTERPESPESRVDT